MIFLLDTITTWVNGILFTSLGIFILYVVCSYGKKKAIVTTRLLRADNSPEKETHKKTPGETGNVSAATGVLVKESSQPAPVKKSGDFSGLSTITDQYYYLPTASVVITATAKVVVIRSVADDVIQSARLIDMALENKIVPEPDTTQLFSLSYNSSAFANDDIRLNINSCGLLDSISAIAEDRITQVLAEVSASPKKILETSKPDRIAEEVTPEEKMQPVKTQTILYTNTFLLTPEDLQRPRIRKSWIIAVDGVAGKAIAVDASFECRHVPRQINFLPADAVVEGILTRPLHRIKMEVHLTDPSHSQSVIPKYDLIVPDPSVLLHIPIERARFVKKVQNPKFSNGLLIENYISKPSEAEGFLSIPINALKAIFSIPAQLLNFKISHIQRETELEKAKQGLAEALQESRKEQQANEVRALQTRLETERTTLTAHKEMLKANNELMNTQKMLTDAKNQIQESWKEIKKEVNNNVPEEIIIEAIKENDAKWKAQYNVLEISAGYKRVNGIDKNITCLVFRPREKLGSGQYVPIPETIHFKGHDIPTDVQETGSEIMAAFIEDINEACDANFPKLPGCSISRLGDDATGTIGLKVFKNNKSYILSCYHVLCATELSREIFEFNPSSTESKIVISPGTNDGGNNSNILGEVVEGKLTEFMDIALASLNDDLDLKTRICRIDQEPSSPVTITLEHAKTQYRVYMSGRSSRFRSASIKSSYSSADIDYGFGKKTIKGLIATSSLANRGDSGAVAFDENCNIIGIVVARSQSNTYIIPISRILSEFNITLKK